jgi:hypothetical protein
MAHHLTTAGTWLLAAYFAVATVVGEAWHLVPGNDHGLRPLVASLRLAPGGSESAEPGTRSAAVASPSQGATGSDTGADVCPICQFLAKARLLSLVVPRPPAPSLTGSMVQLLAPVAIAAMLIACDIRAPPAAERFDMTS